MALAVAIVGKAMKIPSPSPSAIIRWAKVKAASVFPLPVASSRTNSCGVEEIAHDDTCFCIGLASSISGNNVAIPVLLDGSGGSTPTLLLPLVLVAAHGLSNTLRVESLQRDTETAKRRTRSSHSELPDRQKPKKPA